MNFVRSSRRGDSVVEEMKKNVADISMDESVVDSEELGGDENSRREQTVADAGCVFGSPSSAWSLQARPPYYQDDESLSSKVDTDISVGLEEQPSWAVSVPHLRLQPRQKRTRVLEDNDEVGHEDDRVTRFVTTWSILPSSLVLPFIDETIQKSRKRPKTRLLEHGDHQKNNSDLEQHRIESRPCQNRMTLLRPRAVSGGTTIEIHDGSSISTERVTRLAFDVTGDSSPFMAISSPGALLETSKQNYTEGNRIGSDLQNQDPFVTPQQHRLQRSINGADSSFMLAKPQAVRFTQDLLTNCAYNHEARNSTSKAGTGSTAVNSLINALAPSTMSSAFTALSG